MFEKAVFEEATSKYQDTLSVPITSLNSNVTSDTMHDDCLRCLVMRTVCCTLAWCKEATNTFPD